VTAAVDVLGWAERAAAVGVALSAVEWLALGDLWEEGGPCAWGILRLRSRAADSGRFSAARARLFGTFGTRTILWAQLAGCVAVLLPTSPDWHRAALCTTVVALLALRRRLDGGNDGSDQLLALTLGASLLARVAGTPHAAALVLWFLAGQGCLAYATSGWGKLRQRDWRSGAVLRDITSSTLFGSPRIGARLQRRPPEAAWLSRFVIATFVLFPLVFVLPRPLALGLLGAAAAFHIGTAVVMGLTRFPWAFFATYPAVVYCAHL
jgi:hypothetical protein